MKLLIFLLCSVGCLVGKPILNEACTKSGRFLYFAELPELEMNYPIVLAVDGSFGQDRGPHSVLGFHERVAQVFAQSEVGIVTMERFGVNRDYIDKQRFHEKNTPSYRLGHYIDFIDYLNECPPKGWNGKLVILGISEGGPIAIRLADKVKPSALIVLVGCGNQTFKEYIWKILVSMPEEYQQSCFPDIADYTSLQDAYAEQIQLMKKNPDPFLFWFGQSYLYWSDALDLREDQEFLNLKCPILTVTGSQDVECSSTEELIKRAKEQAQDVSYFKVEGAGHRVLDPEWAIDQHLVNFLDNTFKQHL